MNRPKFSVCIPVYNGQETILETLESVMRQTLDDVEILVQDNCSSDKTTDIIREAARKDTRISLQSNSSNLGMVGNWNAVVDRARGEYVLLLSADDCLDPAYLAMADRYFQSSGADAFSTNHTLFWESGRRNRRVKLSTGNYQNHAALVLLKNPFSINFTCFRNSALNALRIHGRVFRRFLSCDYDLHLRFALSGRKVFYLEDIHGHYRLHSNNLSNAKRRMNRHASLTVLGLKYQLAQACPFILRLTFFRFLIRTLILPIRSIPADFRLARILWHRLIQR